MDQSVSTVIKLTYRKNGVKFFGPGVAELLELIDTEGSVKDACLSMGLSYSKGRMILKKAEEALGFNLITIQHGGPGGGASALTEEAEKLIREYRHLEEEVRDFAERRFREMTVK